MRVGGFSNNFKKVS